MTDRLRVAICGALLLISVRGSAQNDTTVNAITQTRDGYLWLGTPQGLERYNGWDFVRTALGTTPIMSLAADTTGTLWIGTETRGLYRLQKNEMTAVAGTGRTVYAIAEDHMHTIWAASDDGIGRFDESSARPLSIAGAPNTATRAVVAAGDAVWVGSDEGLLRYTGGAFTKRTSDVITALAVDRDGKIWIGSHEGGVDVEANGAMTKPTAATPLALTTVDSLAASRDGNIWIGAEGKGVCRLSGDRLDCDPVDDTVRAIFEDREGTIWLGTTNAGLQHLPAGVFVIPAPPSIPHVLLRSRDGSIWTGSPAGLMHNGRTYTVYDGLASTWVHALAEDRDGSMWIGTSGGLSREANGTITTIQSDGDADVRALAVDAAGKLWIGTTTGLQCIDHARLTHCGEARPIFAFDERPDGTVGVPPYENGAVYGVVHDASGKPWYLTSKGIFRGASFVAAFPSDDHVQPAVRRSDDGQLWFQTTRGVVAIDPKHAGPSDAGPPVVIENVSLSEGDAEFRYVALSFVDRQNVRYRTMLEGFDKSWSDAGNRRVATYHDLPPGRYVFHVIAANSGGVWNRTGASVPLRVAAPFWRTWWFAGMLLLAIGVVALIADRVRRENARLEELGSIDPLTRLANRRSLDTAIGRISGQPVAVILCDIDHFKKYNDTYGHQAGDRTLVAVAQAIRAAVEPSGIAARYGGEEFIAVLPNVSADDAGRVAARIVESVRALRIENGDSVVTISAGIAAAADGDAQDLIREADEALYRAKADGRNRFVMATNVRAQRPR